MPCHKKKPCGAPSPFARPACRKQENCCGEFPPPPCSPKETSILLWDSSLGQWVCAPPPYKPSCEYILECVQSVSAEETIPITNETLLLLNPTLSPTPTANGAPSIEARRVGNTAFVSLRGGFISYGVAGVNIVLGVLGANFTPSSIYATGTNASSPNGTSLKQLLANSPWPLDCGAYSIAQDGTVILTTTSTSNPNLRGHFTYFVETTIT